MDTDYFIIHVKTDDICKKKTCVIRRKLKFEDYKNCLEVAQLESKINYLEKNKIDVDSPKEGHKEFIKKQ